MTRTQALAFIRTGCLGASTTLLPDVDLGQDFDSAIKQHSSNYPHELAQDFILPVDIFAIPVPVLFQVNWSKIVRIEYPGGIVPPLYLTNEDYRFYLADATTYAIANLLAGASQITFTTIAQAKFFAKDVLVELRDSVNNEKVWIKSVDYTTGIAQIQPNTTFAYTTITVKKVNAFILVNRAEAVKNFISLVFSAPHDWTDSTQTVPLGDQEPVAHLGASIAARRIAAKFAQTNDSTVPENTIDYRTKETEWNAIADKQKGFYDFHFGFPEGDPLKPGFALAILKRSHEPLIHPDRQLFIYGTPAQIQ
jgi:hypothetical protein